MAKTVPKLVIDYLQCLQQRGVDRIPLDEEARLVLRNWMLAAKRGKSVPRADKSHAQKDHYLPSPLAADDSEAEEAGEETIDEPVDFDLQGNTPQEKLLALRALAENWKPARSLGTLRDTMVFATGNPDTDLMLIGEAPGYHEELQREPFVGRAGEKLNGILSAMNIKRESIYISNIVKFRPAMPRQTTNNRAPSDKEIAASLPIITKEIELIKPKVIVALGATAARGLLSTGQAPLSSLRGRFHDFKGIPVRVTYHPSYLLRTEELSERRKVWEDMLTVMETLGLPISEKQRGYFLPKNNR